MTEPTSIADAIKQGAEITQSPVTPMSDAQLDEITRKELMIARQRDAIMRWDVECPKSMQESRFDEYPRVAVNRAQIDNVLAWQFGEKGLLVTGPTGRGKTRAIWQLLRRLAVKDGIQTRSFHATDFFFKLQENVSFGRDEARGWVEAIARLKLVFIDDLGQEAVTSARADWASSWFMRFLDIRLNEKLPLLVTTNLNAVEISGSKRAIQGDPLLRRLLELCDVVKFTDGNQAATGN